MGNKSSAPRGAENASRPAAGGGAARPGRNAPSTMPNHLASQYNTSNNQRQQQQQQPSGAQAGGGNAPAPPQQPQRPPAQNNATTNRNDNNDRGVQEGQMVKMLATIEASTVTYAPKTQLLTFFITSICPSLTYEIHTGVKEFVSKGKVFYMPNKPKIEPSRIPIDGQQDNRKISIKLDVSKLEEREKSYNKHYAKQMPCVIVLRYRTTELRKREGADAPASGRGNNNEGEECVVEHTEHTAVDLCENPKRRVISQTVTAGGNAYVVENLYGADNDGAAAGEGNEVMVGSTIAPHEGEEDEDGLCVICLTNLKDTAVMPCRHMCMCKECGEQLLKHKPVCPVCRAPISTLLHMPTINQGK